MSAAGRVLAAAAAVAAAASAAAALPPVPPPISPYQQRYLAGVSERAAVASAAAVPELLAALDDVSFRKNLTECCPGIAQLKSQELLEWYQRQVDVTEMESPCNPQQLDFLWK